MRKKVDIFSVYALDPLFEVFNSYTSEEPKITLVFLVNNNHLYPILDETMKRQASRTKKIELQDFKWLVDYEDYEYIENENHIDDTQKQLVLLDKKNLRDVLLKRIKDHHIMVTNIKFINSAVISFEDPFTGKIIESSIDYNLRKLACEKLYDEFLSIEEFKFKNNSFTDLANKIFNFKYGNIPDSCYNEITNSIFEDYPVSPYIKTLTENIKETKQSFGFDICKCYSKVLRDNDHPFPIFTAFDEPRKYTNEINIEYIVGESYIDKDFTLGNGTIKLKNGWYPNNLISYCLKKNYIEKSDITYYLQASFNLKKDYFKEFVEYVYNMFPPNEEQYLRIGKNLINCFIGELNKKYYKNDKGCVTDDYEMACSIFFNQKQKNEPCKISTLDNLFFIRSRKKDIMDSNKCPIWRHIIVGSIINLDYLYNQVCDKNTEVVGYNTDSIFVRNPKKLIMLERMSGIFDSNHGNLNHIKLMIILSGKNMNIFH